MSTALFLIWWCKSNRLCGSISMYMNEQGTGKVNERCSWGRRMNKKKAGTKCVTETGPWVF